MSQPTAGPPGRGEPAPRVQGDAGPAAGIVLAGGRSRRMGRDKATVPWRGTTLLGHVLEVLAAAVDGPLVVVGPAGRAPALPVADGRVLAVADPVPDGGPLQGLATGLETAAAAGASRAVVVSVDLPLLHAEYVRVVLGLLTGGAEVVLPVLHGHRQPLAAAYRTALGARATALIAGGARRPGDLFAVSTVVEATAGDLLADPVLAHLDPGLEAVLGVNTPGELADAARRARSGNRGGGHRAADRAAGGAVTGQGLGPCGA